MQQNYNELKLYSFNIIKNEGKGKPNLENSKKFIVHLT